mmetsp:Transcript_38135/g.83762  ORF Transcript_38135/g.83762 Transcript_38135/m.83762 type:complete len:222 (-) Transcript_38135:204-869(-)
MKCSAISLTVPPLTTTVQPVSAIDLMISSIFFSSDLLYPIRSSAVFIRTVPLASVPLASMAQPNTVILALVADVTVVSLPRRATKPRMTVDCVTLLPRILVTRTESGLTVGLLLLLLLLGDPMVARQASTTRGARSSSLPYCLALRTGLTTLAIRLCRSVQSCTASTASSGRRERRRSPAFLYPATISLGWRPIRSKSSVCPRSSPAKLTVRLVPSPHSLS